MSNWEKNINVDGDELYSAPLSEESEVTIGLFGQADGTEPRKVFVVIVESTDSQSLNQHLFYFKEDGSPGRYRSPIAFTPTWPLNRPALSAEVVTKIRSLKEIIPNDAESIERSLGYLASPGPTAGPGRRGYLEYNLE